MREKQTNAIWCDKFHTPSNNFEITADTFVMISQWKISQRRQIIAFIVNEFFAYFSRIFFASCTSDEREKSLGDSKWNDDIKKAFKKFLTLNIYWQLYRK